jgi:hypothetical protein
MKRNLAPFGIVAAALLLTLASSGISSQAQTPDKGYYVFNLDGYGGALFIGQKSDIDNYSVQSCGPCTTVPKILGTFAGPFGTSDAAWYDLCNFNHVTNFRAGDGNHVARATVYGQENIDVDNYDPSVCTTFNGPPPNLPVVQGPSGGSGSTGPSGSSGGGTPSPTSTPTRAPTNTPIPSPTSSPTSTPTATPTAPATSTTTTTTTTTTPTPSPTPVGGPPGGVLQAHLDCGNYIEVVAGNNQSAPCDIIIDNMASPGPQICVAFPGATVNQLAGLQPNGIVTNSGGSCDDTWNILGTPPRIQEMYAACPVVGICVFPPQPGSVIPAIAASPGDNAVAIVVSQGGSSVFLSLDVNVVASLVTSPPFPFGGCPNGTTGTLTGGPNRFTLSVTNPNASPAGDSYISYVSLQNAVNAFPYLPLWETTPNVNSSLLTVTDVLGQILNPEGGVSGSMRASVPGGVTSTFVLMPSNPPSVDSTQQVLVTAYFGNFLSSCQLVVTLGGPSGTSQAPGVINAFTPITGGNTVGGGSGSSGPGGPIGPTGPTPSGASGPAGPSGGRPSGGSGPSGSSGTSGTSGSTGASGSSGSAGGVATVGGVTVTDVNSCTRALANSGLSSSDASSTCQLVASFVPTGSTFGSFFGCIAAAMNNGSDPVSAAFSCEFAPPTSGGGTTTSGGGTGSSGPTRTTTGPSGGSGSTGSSGAAPVPTSRPSTTGASGGTGSSGGNAGGSSCAGWAGNWNTDFGTMQLIVLGNDVSGTYNYKGGKITGTASGNTLSGKWSQQPSYNPPNDAGDFQFTLAPGGGSFTGQWRYGSSGSWSQWNGTCAGSSAGSPTTGGSPSAGGSPGSGSNCIVILGIQVCS